MPLVLKVGESYLTESGKTTTITEVDTEVIAGVSTLLFSGQVGMEVKDTVWTSDGKLFDGKEGNSILRQQDKVQNIDRSMPVKEAYTEDEVLKYSYGTIKSTEVLSGTLSVKEVKNGYIITLDGNTLIAADSSGVVSAVSEYITEKLTEPEGADV